MSVSIFSEGKEYISASRAAEKIGYASDYIGQLCRAKKIPGKLIGRTWYVDFESLVDHKKNRQLGKPISNKGRTLNTNSQSSTLDQKGLTLEKPAEIFTTNSFKNVVFTYENDDRPRLPELSKDRFKIQDLGVKNDLRSPFWDHKVAKEAFALTFAFIVVFTSGLASLERATPSLAKDIAHRSDQLAALPIAQEFSDTLFSFFTGFNSLKDLALKKFFFASAPIKPFVPRSDLKGSQGLTLPPVSSTQAVTTTAPSYDLSSLRSDLRAELESYLNEKIREASPVNVYNTYSPVINTQTLREEILVADTRPVVTRQSNADTSHFSSAISNLTSGGSFTDATLTNASVSGPSGGFTNFNWTNATGTTLSLTNASTTDFYVSGLASTTNFRTNIGTIGNLTSTFGTLTNLLVNGSSTLQNFFGQTGTLTNLLVNSSSTLQNFSAQTGTLLGNFLVNGSSTLQNFTFQNATGTSATSTNFFATNASSTNLYTNIATFGLATTTGTFAITGNGSGITFHGTGNHDITAAAGTLRIGANTIIGNILALDDTVDIGTAGTRFDKIYANEVNATTLVGTLTGGNLTAETFTINSDNATGDTEDGILSFERGTSTPNALLTWDSTNDRFTFNSDIMIGGTASNIGSGSLLVNSSTTLQHFTFRNATGTNATTTELYVSGLASTTNFRTNVGIIGNLTSTFGTLTNLLLNGSSTLQNLTFQNATGTLLSLFGTNTDGAARFSASSTAGVTLDWIVGVDLSDSGKFKISSSTVLGTNDRFVIDGSGNVGIGTTNPVAKLQVSGTTYLGGVGVSGAFRLYDATAGGTGSYIDFSNSGGILTIAGGQGSASTNNEVRLTADLRPTTDNSYTLGSTALRWNSLRVGTGVSSFAGDVGVGSTTPTARLSVHGGATDTYKDTLFAVASSTAAYATSTHFTILAGGNVGIGTTTPIALLDIFKASGDASQGFTASSTAGVQMAWTIGTDLSDSGKFKISSSTLLGLNDRFVIDGSGNVGIGTTAPLSILHIVKSASGNANGLAVVNNNGATSDSIDIDFGFKNSTPTADQLLATIRSTLTDNTAGSEDTQFDFLTSLNGAALASKMTILSNGNVGIGTTNPAVPFEVSGTNAATFNGIRIQNTRANAANVASSIVLRTTGGSNTIEGGSDGGSGGYLNFITTDTAGTGQDRLRITPAGNVGIGTTSPIANLDIFKASGDASQGFTASSTAGAHLAWTIGTDLSDSGKFKISSSTLLGLNDRFVIDGSGNVGIGTTSPNAKLNVYAGAAGVAPDGDSDDFVIESGAALGMSLLTPAGIRSRINFGSATDNVGALINWDDDQETNGVLGIRTDRTGAVIDFNTGADVFAMRINSSGNVGIGTTGPGDNLEVAESGGAAQLYISSAQASDPGSTLRLRGMRGTLASPTVVGSGDDLSQIITTGYDGNSHENAAGIVFEVDGIPGDGDMPGRMTFYTSADGAVSLSARMTIKNDGNVGIGTTGPGSLLDVVKAGSGAVEGRIRNTGSTDSDTATLRILSSGGFAQLNFQPDGVATANQWAMGTGESETYLSFTGSDDVDDEAPKIVILQDGNVGIGTTTPIALLDTFKASGDASQGFTASSTAGVQMAWTIGTDLSDSGKFKISSSTLLGLNDRFVIDGSGNVGIGTTGPAEKLEVAGNLRITKAGGALQLQIKDTSSATAPAVGINFTGSADAVKWQIATNSSVGTGLEFNEANSGSTRMYIAPTTGNVGIGTTGPGYKLDVQSSGAVTLGSFQSTVAGTANFGQIQVGNDASVDLLVMRALSSTYTTSGINVASGGLIRAGNAGGLSIGATDTAGVIRFYTAGIAAGNERVRIDSSGNVSIGATSNANHLGVTPTFGVAGSFGGQSASVVDEYSNGTGGAILTLGKSRSATIGTLSYPTSGDTLGMIRFSGANVGDSRFEPGADIAAAAGSNWGAANNEGYLTFSTTPVNTLTPVERMRITSSGNIGIGTTTPIALLDIFKASGDASQGFTASSTAGVHLAWTIGTDLSDSGKFKISSSTLLGLNDRFVIDGSGNVGIGTTGPSSALHVVGVSTLSSDIAFTANSIIRRNTSDASDTGTLEINGGGAGGQSRGAGIVLYGNEHASTPGKLELNIGNITGAKFSVHTNAAEVLTIPGSGANSGNVGIGTTSPIANLDIFKASGDASQGFTASSTAGAHLAWTIGTDISDSGKFKISSSTLLGLNDRFVIDGSGNVGIGTTGPAGLFHVSSDTAATGLSFFTQANASADGFDQNFRKARGTAASPTVITTADELGVINFTGYGGAAGYITGAAIKGISSGTIADSRVPGQLSFWTGTDAAPSVLTERMTIDNAGNVGIGTTNPGTRLDIQAASVDMQIKSTTATNPVYTQWVNNTSEQFIIGKLNSAGGGLVTTGGLAYAGIIHQATNRALQLATNENVRMTIDGTGNVGIGTTSPIALLDIFKASGDASQGFTASSTAGAHLAWTIGTDISDSGKFKISSSTLLGLNDRFVIDGNGNVGIGTTGPLELLHIKESTGTNPTTDSPVVAVFQRNTAVLPDASIDIISYTTGVGSLNFGDSDDDNRAIIQYDQGTDLMSFITAASGVKMVINSGGNVGIGTTNPARVLDVQAANNVHLGIDPGTSDSTAIQLVALNNAGAANIPMELRASKFNFSLGNVGIGTTSVNGRVDIRGASVSSTTGMALGLSDADVAHPLTGWAPTTTYAFLNILSDTAGGLQIFGASDAAGDRGIDIEGFIGSTNPTDTVPAVWINGGKSDGGTGQAALGALETVLQLANGGTASVTLLGSGNVGIGTTTPQTLTHLYGTTAPTLTIQRDNTGANMEIGGITFSGGSANTGRARIVAYTPSSDSNGALAFQTQPSSGSLTERMRIDNAGNVGIGTTSPIALLDTFKASGDASQGFTASSTAGAHLAWTIGTDLSDSGKFKISSSTLLGLNDRFVIDGSGNVGIGTTGPATLLDINGVTTFRGNIIAGTDNSYDIGASGATRPRTLYLGTSLNTASIVNPAGTDLTIAPVSGGNILVNFPAGNTHVAIAGPANSTNATTGLLDLSWTWDDAPTAFTLIKGNVTNTNSATGSLLLDLQVGTVSKFNIRKDGQGYFAGNVGIGTTSPIALLDIFKASGDASQGFTASSTAGAHLAWTIGTDLSDSGKFKISSSTLLGLNDRFVIDGSGNVGIGTTGPANKLDVYAPNGNMFALRTSDNSNRLAILMGTSGNNSRLEMYDNTPTLKNLFTASGDNYITGGNVGIGTTTPIALLDIFKASGDASQGFTASSTAGVQMAWTIGTDLSDSGKFKISSSTLLGLNDRFVIDGSGNVGIGTTGPEQLLDVRGGSTDIAGFIVAANSDDSNVIALGSGRLNDNIARIMFDNSTTRLDISTTPDASLSSATPLVSVLSGGNVGIGTTTPRSNFAIGNADNIILSNTYDGAGGFSDVRTGLVLQEGAVRSSFHNYSTGSGATVIGSETNHAVDIIVNNSASINLSTTGARVGIGTASPNSRLTVADTGATQDTNTGDIASFNQDVITAEHGIVAIVTDDTSNSTDWFLVMKSAQATAEDNEFLFRTDGTAQADGTFSGGGADVAEVYIMDGEYEKGDLVEIPEQANGPAGKTLRRHSGISSNSRLIGVVSTFPGLRAGSPAVTEGERDPRSADVALVGRVPIKVNLENGPIKAGDPLTSSSVPGVAMKATSSGTIIGKALEDYDGTIKVSVGTQTVEEEWMALSTENHTIPEPADGVGKIIVYVQVGYWAPSPSLASFLTSYFKGIWNAMIAKFADAANGIGDFFANRVRTKELCVGDSSGAETCITKAQLDSLLANSGGSYTVTTTPNESTSSTSSSDSNGASQADTTTETDTTNGTNETNTTTTESIPTETTPEPEPEPTPESTPEPQPTPETPAGEAAPEPSPEVQP